MSGGTPVSPTVNGCRPSRRRATSWRSANTIIGSAFMTAASTHRMRAPSATASCRWSKPGRRSWSVTITRSMTLWFEAYPGHTPGNVVIHAKSGGERGVFIGDVLHHPLQCLKPEWSTIACTAPDGSLVSRTRLVEEHAVLGTLILPAHFPAPTP